MGQNMALLIEIVKTNETEKEVIYEYFNEPNNVGLLKIDKTSGDFTVLKGAPQNNQILLERVVLKLVKCWRKGEFPKKTGWAS